MGHMTDLAQVRMVEIGNYQAELLHFVLLLVMFTAVMGGLYHLLARPNSIQRDLSDMFKRQVLGYRRSRVLVILSLLWILAVGYVYNDKFGKRFYGVAHEIKDGDPTWVFLFHVPTRTRAVPAHYITNWTGHVSWSRRSFQHALLAEFESGGELRSAGEHRGQFVRTIEALHPIGIHVPVPKPEDLETSN